MERQALVTQVTGLVVPQFERVNFTDAQKKWIRRRDNFQCAHPSDHEHQGNLQVHHIIAQMYAQAYLGLTPEMISVAENGITLCEGIHTGVDTRREPHPDMLHPDHFQARRDYAHDRNAFHKVGMEHRRLASLGLKYWFTGQDDSLLFLSIWRTRQEERRYNHPYPSYHRGK